MIELEDLLPQVMPYTPGAAEPMVIQHLRDAAEAFCKRTRCWRHVDTFQTTADHHQILAVPAQSILYEIEWAKFNDRELERTKPDIHTWHKQTDEIGDFPRYITQVNLGCISIEPHAVGELMVSMFLHPSKDADMVPDFIVNSYGNDIANGALATLLLIPNQPFTNPQMAGLCRSDFQAAIDRNFAFNLRGQQRAAKRTRPNYL